MARDAAPEPAGDGLRVRLRQERPIPLDVELRCAPGELLALVGPSGSGKSTVLRAVAGLYRPRHGDIACNGQSWLDTGRGLNRSPQRRRVGLVFQDYALFPHLSALHNVTAALGHLPPRGRGARGRELLALVNLAGLEDRRPAELSGGQRQRVALARALARDPAVLLLDEPFAAVDQVTRRKLRQELVVLRRRVDMPIVLVTHDLNEAAVLADRLCVLHRGRTLQDGPPAEVMTRPRDALVARVMDLGNIFDAVVFEQRPAAGLTVLRWLDYVLEARQAPAFAPGAELTWVIPPSHVVLHRRDRPSRGEHENPVHGTIGELAELGENTNVTLAVNGRADCSLFFTVATHAATRNGLAIGVAATVSLLSAGIHLMPREERSEQALADPSRHGAATPG
ncbi:MAG: ABC transporter ATP-binding protein [Dongiaceae bacterium]